jgi:hypothetical protein
MPLDFQPRHRRSVRLTSPTEVYQSITKYAMHKTARRVANEFHDTRPLLLNRKNVETLRL